MSKVSEDDVFGCYTDGVIVNINILRQQRHIKHHRKYNLKRMM